MINSRDGKHEIKVSEGGTKYIKLTDEELERSTAAYEASVVGRLEQQVLTLQTLNEHKDKQLATKKDELLTLFKTVNSLQERLIAVMEALYGRIT